MITLSPCVSQNKRKGKNSMLNVVLNFIQTNFSSIISSISCIVLTLAGFKLYLKLASRPKVQNWSGAVLFKNLLPSKDDKSAQLLLGTTIGILRLPPVLESIDIFNSLSKDSQIHIEVLNKNAKRLNTLKIVDIVSIETDEVAIVE